ncbi:MAG TPA: hotdog family protein [Burkholderiaceae bacterium]
MNWPAIATLVPHEAPMILLDRVLHADAETLRAEIELNAQSPFCVNGLVGAWIGIEYMAQAVAAHAGWLALQRSEPVKVGFLLGSRRYQSSVPHFRAGQRLHVQAVRALQGDNGLGAFECAIADADGTSLATATVTVFQPADVKQFLQG